MKESTELLILDVIKKHSSIMPLFSAGFSYAKIIEWVNQLEKEKKIYYDDTGKRMLSNIGIERWKNMKKKKKSFVILPLINYKTKQIDIDEIYLP